MSFPLAALLLHTTSAAIMAYGYNNLPDFAWVRAQKGGHFQYLTIQCLAISWITMMCSLVLDLFPSLTSLKNIKRTLFMVAMPVAAAVSAIYWPLVLFSPKLILQVDPSSPPTAPALTYLPLGVDVSLHAIPIVTLLVDFIFLESKYARAESLYGAPVALSLMAAYYGSWVEYCASYNGSFPYPFLTGNPLEIRIVIYAGAAIFALVSFWTINSSHS